MLQIKQIHKQYKTGNLVQKALDGVSLNLRENEFVAVLGPSGSGKTTLLNIIGGLDRYDSGDLIINGISTKKYRERDWDSYRNHTVGFVFQSYNLIPHQTILSNVELALTISGISRAERRERAKMALEQVGLGQQLHKKPGQMSGGQMQRVAIARALVNDPEILLADEPTGALDSETSVQVMKLLKEVARDRLVVMVTHNPELAEDYATRIVKLRDGKIYSDSDPCEAEINQPEPVHKNMGKASMSFLTALSLSFNNLRTKKTRTLLTSFAGSIGIIGIALILALSNGVNVYIKSVEESTMSEYPLQITSSGFDIASMMVETDEPGEKESSGEVRVSQRITSMLSKVDPNDLEALKAYFDSGKSGIGQYVKAVEYTYDIAPQIYREDNDTVRQVHPDQSFSQMGFGASAGSNSMMSSMMNTDVFHEMPENTELFQNQYEIKAGRWPKQYNECVVVLTSGGRVSDFMLYTLGLRDFVELDDMINQFLAEEDVETPEDISPYSYDDFLGIRFKLVNGAAYYEYDDAYHVWINKQEDEGFLKNLVSKGEDLTIVGVVQPSQEADAAMLSAGIGYPASLTKHVIGQAEESPIVQQQMAQPETDVLTGKLFGDDDQSSFDMSSLFSVNEDALRDAFGFDQDVLNIDMSDFFQINSGDFDLKELDLEDMADLSTLKPELPDLMEYLQTPEAKEILKAGISGMMDGDSLQEKISDVLGNYMKTVTDAYSATIAQAMQEQISAVVEQVTEQMSSIMQTAMQSAMNQIRDSMEDGFTFDPDAFMAAIEIGMDESELAELLRSRMSGEEASYQNNMKKFGYADFDDPGRIDIYPVDFESKTEILKILDGYNDRMTAEGKEEKVITYTDMVGTLMSSVTDIIDTISYVLIAFVAISLVVSSIMIGVITYISVLERKKEIGILRAMGASRGNISQVFNAETFIIGLCAGLMGIGLTQLLLIPGNTLIHSLAGRADINASLPAFYAVMLILLSVILTLTGGLIPSGKAAKSDPVAALRTE